ncbi:TonB-dependent vitamin B12 receptor [Zophobihabitans entericus]|nr:TonB-dependent vitamin B12 receptor [Zophobihabitans entericus]
MKIRKIVTLAVLSASGFAVQAEVTADETLVITANRYEQPISTVLAPISVVTRAQIDQWQVQSVPEILKRLPGVSIGSNGGRGQLTSVFIRGTDSRHVLVLIDGIRMASAGVTGSIDFSQIPVALIQKIEYIRGPFAATYGSDAIGGVINIITESDEEKGEINVSYGSHAYQNYNLAVRHAISNSTKIAVAGGYESISGYDVHPIVGEPDKDGFRSKSFWVGINSQFSDEASGFFRGYGYANSTEYDGSAYSPENERQLYTHNFDTGIRLQKGENTTQLIVSYQRYKDYNYDKDLGKSSVTPVDITQKGIQLGNVYRLEQGAISGGVDFYQEVSEQNTTQQEYHSRTNTGLYLTGQKQISDFILEGAVRGDYNQQYGWHATWQAAVDWQFVENHSATLSYGTAFRAPSFYQLYNMAWTSENLDLDPEKSSQFELAFSGNYDLFNWRLSGYLNKIDRMIDIDPVTWGRYINLDKATIKGVELNVNFDTGFLSHNITAEYLDARYDGGQYDGRILARRPHKSLQYALDANLDALQLSLIYTYKGNRLDSNYSNDVLGGYSLVDIATSYKFDSGLIIRGKISNLFDKDYETALTYPNAGREYTMTLSYEF